MGEGEGIGKLERVRTKVKVGAFWLLLEYSTSFLLKGFRRLIYQLFSLTDADVPMEFGDVKW